MVPFKAVATCWVTWALMAGCSEAPAPVVATENVAVPPAATSPPAKPVAGQTWEPITRAGADGRARAPDQEAGPGSDPLLAHLDTLQGTGSTQAVERGTAPRVPDKIRAAQKAARAPSPLASPTRPVPVNGLQPGERSASTLRQAVEDAKLERGTRP